MTNPNRYDRGGHGRASYCQKSNKPNRCRSGYHTTPQVRAKLVRLKRVDAVGGQKSLGDIVGFAGENHNIPKAFSKAFSGLSSKQVARPGLFPKFSACLA